MKAAELLGSSEMKKNATKLLKMNKRVALVEKLFRFFVNHDWCFETKAIFEMMEAMDEQDKKTFCFNPRTIDWQRHAHLNLYGIQKYYLKMDVSLPHHNQSRLISPMNLYYLQDAKEFLFKTYRIRGRDLSQLTSGVLYADRVQTELRNLSHQDSLPQPEAYKKLIIQSREFLKSLSSTINPRTIQAFFFPLHTVFKRCFDQIIINDEELKQIKNLVKKEG